MDNLVYNYKYFQNYNILHGPIHKAVDVTNSDLAEVEDSVEVRAEMDLVD